MLNHLESNQKWHLIDLLLECPTIKNDKNRRLLVKELPFADTIAENEVSKAYLLNIVNACLNYDNGLEHLLEVLHYFDGETIPFKTLLNEFIKLAIEDAKRMELKQGYTNAIEQWQQIQKWAPQETRVSQALHRLQTKSTQTDNFTDIQEQLYHRKSEITSIYTEVVTCLKQFKKVGMDDEADIILENIKDFLNNKITAKTFMALWLGCLDKSRLIANIPHYPFLADSLQNGDIALFLGLDLPATCEPNLPDVDKIVSQLANEVEYSHFQGTFPEIWEYIKRNREVSRSRLLQKLKELIDPPNLVPIKLYQLLATIEMPLLLISALYDTLLERTFHQQGKKFVVFCHVPQNPGTFLVKYSDRATPENPCFIDEHPDFSPLEKGYSIIFKILGGFCDTSPETLTVTESDHLTELTQKKLIPAYVATKLREQSLWLLGHEPKKWEKRLMIRKILETSTRTSIIIPQVDEFSRVYLEDLNIKPYRIHINEFVDNLQKHV